MCEYDSQNLALRMNASGKSSVLAASFPPSRPPLPSSRPVARSFEAETVAFAEIIHPSIFGSVVC